MPRKKNKIIDEPEVEEVESQEIEQPEVLDEEPSVVDEELPVVDEVVIEQSLDRPSWLDITVWNGLNDEQKKRLCNGESLEDVKK